jgi:LPXTG-motif cell wall-anchored protein
VKRVVGIARGRAGRAGLVAGVVVAAVVGLSAPAFAHYSTQSGQTSCSDGAHVITWSIHNSESNQKMTIDSATAVAGGQSYAVTGYAQPVDFSGTTSATTVVPGGTTGTAVLTIHTSWPDHITYSGTAQVTLLSDCSTTTTQSTTTTTYPTTTTTYPVTTTTQHQCECSTTTTQPVTTTTQHQCECSTTTTQPVTTTTAAQTTTTTEPVTTTTQKIRELGSTTIVTTTTQPKAKPSTTLGAQGSTVPTTLASPIAAVLPHTGSGTTVPVIFGGLCIGIGAALAMRKRNAWSRP